VVPLACMKAGQCYGVIHDRQFHKDMTLLATWHDTAQPHEASVWRFASVKERTVINAVLVIWLLKVFGGLGSLHDVRIR
jgi:hypothetical protein